VPQLEPKSVYEQLPGSGDPRAPLTTEERRDLSGGFFIGSTIANLRRIRLPCTGQAFGPVTERYGDTEWRITGCSDGAGFEELRIEEANPTAAIPRFAVYTRRSGEAYRLAGIGGGPPGTAEDDEAHAALLALTLPQLDELERRVQTLR
jgi:hypothetical protein